MSRDPLTLLQRRFDETQRVARLGSWELALGDFPLEEGALWWSAETCRQLGYAPGSVVPTVALFLDRLPESEREAALIALQAARGSGTYESIHRIEPQAGMFRVVHLQAVLVTDEGDDHALRLAGTMRDITDRVHDEREAEELSHSISHDLRAPLRHIEGFTRILQDDHAASLAPEGRGHLERIVRSANRMAELIDGLLAYTRVGQQAYRELALDMEALADGAIDTLRAACEGRTIHWTRQSLAPAIGDATLMRLVWEHLLANAVKFTRAREPAQITIGAEQEGHDTWYFVEDNGAGFAPQYARRLFTLFQRLHRPEDFEGTGVGLAIARRAVRRHGGRIEAWGEAGRGARVRFCLPPASPR